MSMQLLFITSLPSSASARSQTVVAAAVLAGTYAAAFVGQYDLPAEQLDLRLLCFLHYSFLENLRELKEK